MTFYFKSSQHKIFDAFLKPKFTNPRHYCFSKKFIIQSCWVEQKCESEQFRSLNKETHQFVISEVSLIQTTSWPGKWEILTYALWTQQTTNNCFCWNRTWLSEGEPRSETSKLKGFGWRDFTWDYVIRLWRWYPKLEKWYLKKKCKVNWCRYSKTHEYCVITINNVLDLCKNWTHNKTKTGKTWTFL